MDVRSLDFVADTEGSVVEAETAIFQLLVLPGPLDRFLAVALFFSH